MPASNYYVAALKLDRRDEEGGEAKEEERREEEGRKAKEEEREVNEERGVAKEASRRESIGSLSGSRVSLQSQQSLTRMSEEYLNKGPLDVLLVVVKMGNAFCGFTRFVCACMFIWYCLVT